MYVSSRGAIQQWRQPVDPLVVGATLAPRPRYGLRARHGRAMVPLVYGTAGDSPEPEAPVGGGYDDTPARPRKRDKLTVIHPDTREEREAEFEALLQRVKGQAQEKAKALAQSAPAAVPSEVKPPRMPEIRGVESAQLRQWMPELLSTYRATFAAELQALQSAQAAAAQRQAELQTAALLARQMEDDEEIALLAMLA